ncbi:MAG: choice-of-anchor D domain-containing protein [Ilumatobacteraceae bacterium]
MKFLRASVAMTIAVVACIAGVVRPASAVNPDAMFVEGEDGTLEVGPQHLSFTAPTVTGGPSQLTISVDEGGHQVTVSLAAPTGGTLGVGVFGDTQLLPDAAHPGLDVSGDGTQCSGPTGAFAIDELVFDASNHPIALVARWEFHCSANTRASFGAVTINGTAPYRDRTITRSIGFNHTQIGEVSSIQAAVIHNSGPAALHLGFVRLDGRDTSSFHIDTDGCSFAVLEAGEECEVALSFRPAAIGDLSAELSVEDDLSLVPGGGAGQAVLLAGTGTSVGRAAWVEQEAEGFDQGRRASYVAVTASGTTSGVTLRMFNPVLPPLYQHSADLTLQPPTGSSLAAGAYEDVRDIRDATHGRLRLSGDGPGATTYMGGGRFIVDEIAFGQNGQLERLVARWEFRGSPTGQRVFGMITFDGTVPYLDRSITPYELTFDATSVGATSAPQSATISNAGPATLHVDRVTITGAGAENFTITDDPCSGHDIAPGDECVVTTVMTPHDFELVTARLTIFDSISPDDGHATGRDILLSGHSIPPPVRLFLEGEELDELVAPRHIDFTSAGVVGDHTAIVITAAENASAWWMRFEPPTGTQVQPGTWPITAISQRTATTAGFQIRGSTCPTPTGLITISEVTFGPTGLMRTLAASWEFHCSGEDPASFGAIEFGTNSGFTSVEITPLVEFSDIQPDTASAEMPIDISNHGSADLHIGTVVLAGPDASKFEVVADPCSGADIASGVTCSVTVRFNPSEPMTDHTAFVTITNDSQPVGSRGQRVLLTGHSTVGPNSPHGEFTPVTPARILDTRDGTGAPLAKIGPDSFIDVQVTGQGGVPASGVSAVVVNVTAVKPTANTFITLWPTGTTRPTVSNLNPAAGKAVPNMAIVPLGADGKISAYNSIGSTDLLLDVVGYYSSYSGAAGSRFHAIEPFRAVDTRNGTGAPKAVITAGGSLRIDLRGSNGVLPASGMTAVVLNVTAVKPTATGFVTVFPGDVPRPTASNLNTSPGVTAPNLVTVRVPANGIVEFYNSAGSTHLLVDVVGYYDGVRNGEAGRFIPIAPVRSWDTRDDNDPLAPGDVTSFQIASFNGVPADAAAVAANFTAVKPTGNGYLTVFPDDVCSIPAVSTLNFSAGQIVPNMAVTKLSSATGCALGLGWVAIFNPTGYTHVLIDVAGYFT